MKIPTRKELREHRRRLSEMVREGKTVSQVARETGRNYCTVKKACEENGVTPPRGYDGKPFSSFRVLALLLNTTDSIDEIAMTIGVSHQRVSQVVSLAKKVGIQVPARG